MNGYGRKDTMERVKIKEAAKLLGVSEQFVRIGMQREILPIGVAVKMSSKWTYHISPGLLEAYLNKKMPPAATDGKRFTTE